MKFTNPEVQAVYLTLVELHAQTLLKENVDLNEDFMKGKRIAYAMAMQVLRNNCTFRIGREVLEQET